MKWTMLLIHMEKTVVILTVATCNTGATIKVTAWNALCKVDLFVIGPKILLQLTPAYTVAIAKAL